MRLGLRENLQETIIFQGKSWFLMFAVDFSWGRSEISIDYKSRPDMQVWLLQFLRFLISGLLISCEWCISDKMKWVHFSSVLRNVAADFNRHPGDSFRVVYQINID